MSGFPSRTLLDSIRIAKNANRTKEVGEDIRTQGDERGEREEGREGTEEGAKGARKYECACVPSGKEA